MKKALTLFLAFGLLLSVTACGSKKEEEKKEDTTKTEEKSIYEEDGTVKPVEDVVENKTETKQGDITFSEVKISQLGASNIVTTKVTNNGGKEVSFEAVLYMKNADGRILGKLSKQITKLGAGKSEDIEHTVVGDYTTVRSFEVKVEGLK